MDDTQRAIKPTKAKTSKAQIKATRKYNLKTYNVLRVYIKKDLDAVFKERLQKRGDTVTGVFRQAIIRYIGQGEDREDD
jgi:hypothetical protein